METSTAPARLRALPTWLLGQAALAARGLVAERLGAVGAHRSHYAMLAALDELGPLSQAELGRRIGLDRSDVAALVAELHAAGQVDRAPDPADRRRNVVTVTGAGRARLVELDGEVAEAQASLLAPLGPHDRETLVRILAQLTGATPAD